MSGFSHATAALVLFLVGPFLKRFIELLITGEDVESAVIVLNVMISSRASQSLAPEVTPTILYLAVIGLLAFIWGYTYHVKRHTQGRD